MTLTSMILYTDPPENFLANTSELRLFGISQMSQIQMIRGLP